MFTKLIIGYYSTSPPVTIGSNLNTYHNNQVSKNSQVLGFFFPHFFTKKRRKKKEKRNKSSESYAYPFYNYFYRGFYLLSGPFFAGLMLQLP